MFEMRAKEMNTNYLSIGGFLLRIDFIKHTDPEIIGINNIKDQIKLLFSSFIVAPKENKIDFKIELVPQNVVYEQPNKRDAYLYFFKERGLSITSFAHISIGQFVFLVLYAIQKLLIKNGGFFFHGSAISNNGEAMIFTGRPGAGKSTASLLLGKTYPILADDSMIIRKQDNQFYLYQVPAIEKNKKISRSPNKYKISKIFFLKKSLIGSTSILSGSSKLYLDFFKEVWSQQQDLVSQKKIIIDTVNILVKQESIILLKFPKKATVLNKLVNQHAQAGPRQ